MSRVRPNPVCGVSQVQLVGRKRFILFPPDDFEALYPFPLHHDFDRRSQLDLDALDVLRFPESVHARGIVVELQPGEVLFIPPYWWHHVQTCTSPCVSMAIWFFERTADAPQLRNGQLPDPERAIDPGLFGCGVASVGLQLARWVETAVGRLLPEMGSDQVGSEAAKQHIDSWGGTEKARAVAAWMDLIYQLVGGVTSALSARGTEAVAESTGGAADDGDAAAAPLVVGGDDAAGVMAARAARVRAKAPMMVEVQSLVEEFRRRIAREFGGADAAADAFLQRMIRRRFVV